MSLYSLNGSNGQLYVYEDHLEIERKGLLGKLTHLKTGDTYLSFSEIDSVKFRLGTPLFSGYFYFRRIGDNKKCNLIQAAQDEDCIVFRFFENRNASKIRKYLIAHI